MHRFAYDNERMHFRIQPEQKTMLLRAAAARNTRLTDFDIQVAFPEAKAVLAEAERLTL